jgi:hypothetical protein
MPAMTAKDSLTAAAVAASCCPLRGAATASRKLSLTTGSLTGLKLGVGELLGLAPALSVLVGLPERVGDVVALRASVWEGVRVEEKEAGK